MNVFQAVGDSPSIVPLIWEDTGGAHAVDFGEADSLCDLCQYRMQKRLPALAEVLLLGM